MLLGKRPRNPMKRTTSLSEITFDLNTNENNNTTTEAAVTSHPLDHTKQASWSLGHLDQRLSKPASSPKNKRTSANFLETAPFLKSCFLCKRRLVHSRDIYMYRGDSAFCSLECRQQQMNLDERKEKCSLASKKEVSTTSTTQPQVSAKGETLAAV